MKVLTKGGYFRCTKERAGISALLSFVPKSISSISKILSFQSIRKKIIFSEYIASMFHCNIIVLLPKKILS